MHLASLVLQFQVEGIGLSLQYAFLDMGFVPLKESPRGCCAPARLKAQINFPLPSRECLGSSNVFVLTKIVVAYHVILNESRSTPLLLFLKDIEKSIVGNQDAYSGLKSKLQNLSDRIIVIGSHTQMSNRKEKFFRCVAECPHIFDDLCNQPNSNWDHLCNIQTGMMKLYFWVGSNRLERDVETPKHSQYYVVTENELEKKLLAGVIPPNEIGVTFDDIGTLETVKDALKELVKLPFQRPEFFGKGQLTKNLCVIAAHCPIREILGKEEKVVMKFFNINVSPTPLKGLFIQGPVFALGRVEVQMSLLLVNCLTSSILGFVGSLFNQSHSFAWSLFTPFACS
ncbi:hypothetical protein K2173_011491 [Erythroxylum novogranatense]|uniref:Uncharacterized protein n=1 Tax=Erythroxylum novogranatense TaxID=1862640 RepID=A0AAV8TT61_9ROSI|nr:hypothetical protein K2173_011491 [Erythroxylum novogranatense]